MNSILDLIGGGTAFTLLHGVVDGMRLFLLASGLTLIFSMMGVLNFAHASFYMLGAYIAYTVASTFNSFGITLFGIEIAGYWLGLIIAPIVIGLVGALVQRYMLSRVHQYGHVPELIFTFSLAIVIGQAVIFMWGTDAVPANQLFPESLKGAIFTIQLNETATIDFPLYKIFMLGISIAIFAALVIILKRTRIGLIIQGAITHPSVVGMLGHNVPFVFMLVFGVGCLLAGVAGVITGPLLGTDPGMAQSLGPIIFVVIVIGGLGSLAGAFIASLMIGLLEAFANESSSSLSSFFEWIGMDFIGAAIPDWIWNLQISQTASLIPYLLLVLMLIFRPLGLMGNREV